MVKLQDISHLGHRAVELVDGNARMVIVTSIGPRIAWFGRTGGGNLLYWDDAGVHRRGDWQLYGGHRMWTTRPMADESEEVHEPDNEPCRVLPITDGVRIVAPPGQLRVEKSLVVTASGGVWTVAHELRNHGTLLWSGGAWALTCTLPTADTVYRVPLGGGPAGWDVATIAIPLRWGDGHTSRLDDPQFTLTADAMEFRALGDEAKRMVRAPQGLLEMRDPERGVFRKRTEFALDAAYPLDTNLAVYLGPRRFMVELETMSPMRTLAPGGALAHVETWSLESR